MLTPEELNFYQDNGFVFKRNVVPQSLIEQIKNEIADVHEDLAENNNPELFPTYEQTSKDAPKKIRQLMHSERYSTSINEVLHSDAVLDVIEQMIGPEIALYHSKLLPKTQGGGAAVPWHQDYAYWATPESEPYMVNMMLAIDPTTLENGCTRYLPGSHKNGPLTHNHEVGNGFVNRIGEYHEDPKAVPALLAPGDALFFNCLVVHGSPQNTSQQPRRINTFAFDVIGNPAHPHNPHREVLRSKKTTLV